MPIRTERSESMSATRQRIAARTNGSAPRDGALGLPARSYMPPNIQNGSNLGSGRAPLRALLGRRACAPSLDRYVGCTGFSSQLTDQQADAGPEKLFAPLDDEPDTDYIPDGVFGRRANAQSPQWWLRSHGRPLTFAGLVSRSEGPPMIAHVTPRIGGW